MKVLRFGMALALATVAIGCSNSSAPTPVACGSGANPLNCVPTVNGHRVDQAQSCDSIVGHVLTKADETAICTLSDGTIETANVTVCGNGQTYINFGLDPSVSGLEGQPAGKTTGDWALDRTTCVATLLASPSMTTSPTAAPTPSGSAATGSLCVLQIPAQMGTDMTPITIVYAGADSSQCAQYLAQQNAGKTGWEAAHPATIISTVPAGKPICSGTVEGLSVAIYGTAAAQYACSALGLK
jgi:hypothetical protein